MSNDDVINGKCAVFVHIIKLPRVVVCFTESELIFEEFPLNIAIMLHEHNVHICLDLIVQLVPRVLTVKWHEHLEVKLFSVFS